MRNCMMFLHVPAQNAASRRVAVAVHYVPVLDFVVHKVELRCMDMNGVCAFVSALLVCRNLASLTTWIVPAPNHLHILRAQHLT